MAFIKRLSIISLQSSAPIAAGILLLISEVCKNRPALFAMLTAAADVTATTTTTTITAVSDDDESAHQLGAFDASKREPQYAASGTPVLWELCLLADHYHPSVKAFATSILSPPEHQVHFDGDPTTEFSVIAFLNRFSYKNPKKRLDEKIQRPQATVENPLNALGFMSSEQADVAPDKQFFYKFFGDREALRQQGKAKDRSRNTKRLLGDHPDMRGDGGSDGEGDDEEREMDAYADKLAEELMRSHENNADPDDDDMDDEDAVDEDEGDDDSTVNSEDGEAEDGDEDEGSDSGALDFADFVDEQAKGKKSKGKKVSQISDFDEAGSDEEDRDDEEEDGGDAYQLMAYGDEDDDEAEEQDDEDDEDDVDLFGDDHENGKQASKGKKSRRNADLEEPVSKKHRKQVSDSDFADAADYEEEMESIVQSHSLVNKLAKAAKNTKGGNKTNQKTFTKSNSHQTSSKGKLRK